MPRGASEPAPEARGGDASERVDGARDSLGLVTASAVAAVALGRAIQVAEGHFSAEAISWVGVALVVLLLGITIRPRLERFGTRPLWIILGIGLLLQFLQLALEKPAFYLTETARADVGTFGWAMAVAGLLALGAVFGPASLRRILTPALIVVYLLAGMWVIRSSPEPKIDVHVLHEHAIEALSEGRDPYGNTVPNIYEHSRFYAPGLVQDGRVQLGFPYPPLSLLMSAPGQLLAGDFRYAHLLAAAIAGALIAYGRPGRIATAAAILFLFTPRSFFVVEQGWTEPLMLMLLAVVGFSVLRGWRSMPYLAGALVASKQYAILFYPLLLLVRRIRSGVETFDLLGKALIVPIAVTVPFFMWDPQDFVHDVFTVHARVPFREEGLTFFSLWSRLTDSVPPSWIGWLVALGMLILVLLKAPRRLTGFAAGGALVLAFFFAFSRTAFANYYYFVLGALWIAVGMAALPRAGRSPPTARVA